MFKALKDAGRGDLIPRPNAADDFADDDDDPAPASAANEWVWVADAEQFVRRSDSKKFTGAQWKSMHGHLMPDRDIVVQMQRGKFPMLKFESLVYLPCAAEFPDGEHGARYNIWRPSGVEAKPGDVRPFLDHMEHLFPTEAERTHVLDYLALLTQRPADKIHFSLLIRGRQGTGKSWLGKLMSKIVGERNVTRPSNGEVTSRWTAWMEGAQLGIIEELMALGRLDVMNRLKPVITDDFIRIEDKGCKLYSIPNHLDLICFTNHDDAVPIENGDRRWLVVFSPAEPQDDSYYERLFGFLEGDGPSAVKQWLLDRAVKLNPKGVAPRTQGKESMRRLSLAEVDSYLLELFEQGAPPFDFDLVRVEEVVGAVPPDISRRTRNVRHRVIHFLRTEIGAMDHTRHTKNDGRPNWTLWSIRDHERWKSLGGAGRIDAFVAHQHTL